MENEEKMMTGEESLKIITEMINKTKVSIRQGSFHLLFWGWLLIVCSLSAWLLANYTSYAHPYFVWFLVIPGAFVSMIYGFVNGRKETVHSTIHYSGEKHANCNPLYSFASRISNVSFRVHY